ncbi:MAG: NUDIX hydrolase [Pirellulaceae bacterium]
MRSLSDHPLRHGAVAVIPRGDCLLVIQRSALVEAPGTYCFPGGALERGESAPVALCRELREELEVDILPRRAVWHCVTPWGVDLSWWLADLDPAVPLRPNPAEVASAHWLTLEQIRELPQLLTSNHLFLQALERGEFTLAPSD